MGGNKSISSGKIFLWTQVLRMLAVLTGALAVLTSHNWDPVNG